MKQNWLAKVLSLVLAMTMVLGIVGCADTGKETQGEKTTASADKDTIAADKTTEAGEVEVSYPLNTDKTFKHVSSGTMILHSEYSSYTESPFHTGLAKNTGVDVEWQFVKNDQLELMLAEPEDRPEVFSRGWVNAASIVQWAADGVIVDLTDYLPKYAPDFWEYINRPENETTMRTITDAEGRFWYIPGILESEKDITYKGPVIRKDWLKECGLDMPVTLDDVEKVLIAFKDKYGATLSGTYDDFCEYGFASGADAFSSMWPRLYAEDGNVKFANAQPEFKELMERYAKWYEMGLFDPDFFTSDRALVRQKAADGETGMIYTAQSQMTMYLQDAADKNTGAEWVAMPYVRTEAGAPTKLIQTGASKFTNLHFSFITTKCDEEMIAVVLQWLNYAFTEEGMMYTNFGTKGETYTVDANGKVQFTELLTKDPLGVAGAYPRYAVWNNTSVGVQLHAYKEAFNDPIVMEANNVWTENTVASQYFLPSLALSEEDSVTYSDKMNAVNTYAEQMAVKFVTGEVSLDAFDDYLKELDKLGLQEALAIQQKAYDAFLAK